MTDQPTNPTQPTRSNQPMTTKTVFYPVRFSGLVLAEMQAISESLIDPKEVVDAESKFLSDIVTACWNAPCVVRRKNLNNTYEAHLTLSGVRVFAREVAYYRYHAEECLRECDRSDAFTRADLRRTINACQSAINGANKVLVGAGEEPITSYWD